MRKHDEECEMKDGYLSCGCPRIGPKSGNNCSCYIETYNGEQMISHCPLHMATPELLEACQMFVKAQLSGNRHAWVVASMKASAAIAKAEGR